MFLGGMFLASGVGLGTVAVRQFGRRRAFVRDSAVATGVVVALREERDGTDVQPLVSPKVRFQAASGREITFESRLARGRDAWSVGRPVPVRYLTAQPETAELEGPLALWGATVVFAALAITFLAAGLGLCLGLIPG